MGVELAILGTALAGAATAEEQRKSASKAAAKAERIRKEEERRIGPTGTPESGGDSMDAIKRRKKFGRADTIQAGSLIPEYVGTKSLLG